jgi:putative FmdB family regulatory protein
MPMYEYFCRTCNSKFEKLQPLSASDKSATCPDGHDGAIRTLSLIARPIGDGGTDMAMGCGCGGACSCGSFGRN